MTEHLYELTLEWTGDRGTGTKSYAGYGRDHIVSAEGRSKIRGSADPAFRGDSSRWNPEQLLLAALSQCHMLAFLHLCSQAGVVVHEYVDRPTGTMTTDLDGSGQFTEVVLRPRVTVAAHDQTSMAEQLHEKAHAMCFIARSVSFPVKHEPETAVTG